MTMRRGRGWALTRRAAAEMERDDLTGVLTHDAAAAVIRDEIERAEDGSGLTVAMIDIDGLGRVNAKHGRLAGDGVLRAAAAVIRSSFRQYDLVARWGGDELLCALPSVDLIGTAARFADIQEALASATEDRARFSVGLAELRPGDTLEGLVARAGADLEVSRRRRQRRQRR